MCELFIIYFREEFLYKNFICQYFLMIFYKVIFKTPSPKEKKEKPD